MKIFSKLLIISYLLSILASSNLFAKTQGLNLGIQYVLTHAKYRQIIQYDPESDRVGLPDETYITKEYADNFHGAGVDIKYAFNSNNFFLAPGIFYEQNSFGNQYSKASDQDFNESIMIQHRFGVKADIGYDINYFFNNATQTFSPYISGGYAGIKYKTRTYLSEFFGAEESVNQDHYYNWFAGGGIKFEIFDNFAINFEYNYQPVSLESNIEDRLKYDYRSARYKTILHIFRAGLVFGF